MARPVLDYLGSHRPQIGGMLSDLGYGLAQGGFKAGLGLAAQRSADMQPLRAQEQAQRDAAAKAAGQTNQTISWLRQKGQSDPRFAQLADAVDSGGMDISSAWSSAIGMLNERPKPRDLIKVGQGDSIYDPNSGQSVYTAPTDPKAPTLPAGYQADPTNPNALMPTPGGPADTSKQDEQKRQRASDQLDTTLSAVNKALSQTNYLTTGVAGAAQGMVPGSWGYDLRRTVDTIKANLGFQALQEMRDASPTGGALGQVTEQELALLQSTVASLDANQSEVQLAANLAFIKQHLEKLKALQGSAAAATPDAGDDFRVLSVQ